MKRTEDDKEYGEEFARQLQPFYDEAMARGETEKTFAARLGVDRGGLQRYLREHSMPSLRTAVFAYAQFGIVINYAGISTQTVLATNKRKNRRPSVMQMDLPLTIEAPNGEITVVVKKKTPQRYRFQVHLRKVSPG